MMYPYLPPLEPEPQDTPAHKMQDQLTRAQWQGVGCTEPFESTHSTANNPNGKGEK